MQNGFGNETLIGVYGSKSVAFPDFSHPDTSAWYTNYLNETILARLPPSSAAGFNLIRNSPFANLVNVECDLGGFPFLPSSVVNETILGIGTICPDAMQNRSRHFRRHNVYANDNVAQGPEL